MTTARRFAPAGFLMLVVSTELTVTAVQTQPQMLGHVVSATRG
jgi:hypothetical protein